MKKPILYLHIGAHKTGTTAIQASLALNNKYLQNLGICAPANTKINVNEPLFLNLHWQFSSIDFRTFDITPPEIYLEEYLRCFTTSSCDRLIISSEEIFPSRPYINYNQIRKWIKKHFQQFEIKIICYLRRQDLYLESMYSQVIKMISSENPEPKEMLSRVYNDAKKDYPFSIKSKMTPFDYYALNAAHYIEYDKVITDFADVFGKENIIIRPYELSQLSNGLIYDFYRNTIGLTDNQVSGLKPVGSINESLTRDVLEFKLASKIDDMRLFLCVNELLKDDNVPSNSFLSDKKRNELLEFCKTGNAFIAKEYLSRVNGRLFIDNIKKYEQYSGLSFNNSLRIRKAIIPLLKNYYKDLGSFAHDEEIEANLATSNDVIESTRRLYFRQVGIGYIRDKTTELLHSLKGKKSIVIYGLYGHISEWVLRATVPFIKSIKIYIADRRLQSLPGVYLYNEWFTCINIEAIKALNPDVIIITAALSGPEIKSQLEKLGLNKTIIYPAYDFSDSCWSRFNF